ncbi:pyridoxal-phosphate dependent enzyme [Rhizobium leguminosarum]|uniref:pyridoxal-phosphate dependent enzyme n=1 Tax=Rhizobium leguminosarum TaxID=384 RepID=UPI0028C471F3|nr:pyridoxal-phosphate dependent enzyme [Rhizobium leguminosarum]
MTMGVARILKSRSASVRIVVLEPASSPVISEEWAGTHHVEGIGVGFVPPLLDHHLYDEARSIPEEEARTICHQLAREEGLLVGPSTGSTSLRRFVWPRKSARVRRSSRSRATPA